MDDRMLNLEEVSHLVALKCGWREDKRWKVLAEYEEYLASVASQSNKPSGLNRPTHDVDALWHEHILNTTLYVDYCLANFGFYLHHVSCIPGKYRQALSSLINREIPPGESGSFAVHQQMDGGEDEVAGVEPSRLADCGPGGPSGNEIECGGEHSGKNNNLLADCGGEHSGKNNNLLADCGSPTPQPERCKSLNVFKFER